MYEEYLLWIAKFDCGYCIYEATNMDYSVESVYNDDYNFNKFLEQL
jgi:hypothetical protein